MSEHVASALFIYTKESSQFLELLQDNAFGAAITPIAFDELQQDPPGILDGTEHVVVSGGLTVIRAVLELAMQHDFSVGIVPLTSQKELIRTYGLPGGTEAAIDLALQQDAQRVNLILCNGTIILNKATIGRLPLIDSAREIGRRGMMAQAAKMFIGLRLLPFRFVTADGQKVKTAACGCKIVPYQTGNRAFRNIARYSSVGDGLVTLIISAPSSILRYLKFLWQTLSLFTGQPKRLPDTLGYIKSSGIDIESEVEMVVKIDSETTSPLPLHCEALPKAVGINVGAKLRDEIRNIKPARKKLSIKNLPTGKEELVKARKKKIPFFSYASEERFRDLFLALREDARTNSAYLSLMVLSTMLATVGLYQNSTAVIIGAMLLAPLMAPIISLAMGLLRQDRNLSKQSIKKILVGIAIALLAAASITLLFPHKPITAEMEGRLNPSLLDLAVAIVAGAAGAYTKAYKEILQSLAGVAIAVALVPPLAVAGIGLGQLDLFFFGQAFLLFSTNLIGIILAASFTFRVLGYSPAIRDRRSIKIVALALVMITVPLYLSYTRIVETNVLERSWQHERFLVNGKYLIVHKADLNHYRDKDVMTVDILAREVITRQDLTLFREKIQANFDKKLIVRASIIYIP